MLTAANRITRATTPAIDARREFMRYMKFTKTIAWFVTIETACRNDQATKLKVLQAGRLRHPGRETRILSSARTVVMNSSAWTSRCSGPSRNALSARNRSRYRRVRYCGRPQLELGFEV